MEEMLLPIEEKKPVEYKFECKVVEFAHEFNDIEDLGIKFVTHEIIKNVMDTIKISRKTIDYTKKVVHIVRSLCDSRGYTNLAKDVVTASALLHDLYYKKSGDLHVVMIRYNHQAELRKLDPSIAENICSIIEGHHGYSSILPKIASKEGTIEQLLTDAVVLAERM